MSLDVWRLDGEGAEAPRAIGHAEGFPNSRILIKSMLLATFAGPVPMCQVPQPSFQAPKPEALNPNRKP